MENNSFTKKASQKLKLSYVKSRNFNNFKKKSLRLRVKKIPSHEDLVKLAAELIREEIRNTPNIHKLATDCRRIAPKKSYFATSYGSLFKTNSFLQNKPAIVYNVINTKHRTSKHALLSICIKRRTGSKKMIRWLNMFGYAISCNETNLAEDEI